MIEQQIAAPLSLLWPTGRAPATDPGASMWGERAAADLSIERLAEYLSPDLQHKAALLSFLLTLTTDLDVIRYRQEILEDCLRLPAVAAMLEELQPALKELQFIGGPCPMDQTPLHKTVYRLGELELYAECIQKLHAGLTAPGERLHSAGLQALRDHVAAVDTEPEFRSMAHALPDLRLRLDSIRGLTIGVNLDDSLRPVEATLLSVHSKPVKGGTFLGQLFGRGSAKDHQGIAPLHSVPFKTIKGMQAFQNVDTPEREDPMLFPLFRDLDRLMKETAKPVAQALSEYLQVNTRPLAGIGEEVIFYRSAVRLLRRLTDAGLPVCRPECAPLEERVCDIEGLYNIHLALRLLGEGNTHDLQDAIVASDVHFGEQGRIFILTGPNRGGKTTFTEAVGLAQVLFQAGLPVPGVRARISPVDGIFTHFPVEERPSMDAGRLGEEAARLGDIFRHVTRGSLVLLNESFSSTSPGEGLYLAQDVVRALRQVGARALFATHLHELGHVENLNADTPGDSLAASLVAGSATVEAACGTSEPEARRTYCIQPGPPQGISHARDIARKYGIELHQLLDTLRERKVM